jgi:hypothetical protein
MGSDVTVRAKADDQASRSDSIVVSFEAHWYDAIRSCRLPWVMRKRVPVAYIPRRLYFHVNSPRSCICARAEIQSVDALSLEDAVRNSGRLHLSERDIRAYFGPLKEVGRYVLRAVERAPTEASTQVIAKRMVYFAPQSFFFLSTDGLRILDELCGFDVRHKPPREGRDR